MCRSLLVSDSFEPLNFFRQKRRESTIPHLLIKNTCEHCFSSRIWRVDFFSSSLLLHDAALLTEKHWCNRRTSVSVTCQLDHYPQGNFYYADRHQTHWWQWTAPVNGQGHKHKYLKRRMAAAFMKWIIQVCAGLVILIVIKIKQIIADNHWVITAIYLFNYRICSPMNQLTSIVWGKHLLVIAKECVFMLSYDNYIPNMRLIYSSVGNKTSFAVADSN